MYKRQTAHCIITQMLRHLYYQRSSILLLNVDCLLNGRQSATGEFNIQHGANDLRDFSYILFCHIFTPFLAL